MNNTYSSSLPKVPTQPQSVKVSVSADNIEDFLAFLLTKKISFRLTYESMVVPAKPLKPHNNFANEIPEKSIDVHSLPLKLPIQNIMETIYQKYICDNIRQIPPNETIIAEEYHLQVATFKKNFKACYGKSFYQLYMDKRMEYAAQLLRRGYRANKVSAMVGYGEKSCIKFKKMFQKHFGITPKKYQIQNQK